MLEVFAIFLIVYGVISMLTAYSITSLLSSVIVVAMLVLLSSAIQRKKRP
jgi:hypothetical protein